jgi:hypothetical protein
MKNQKRGIILWVDLRNPNKFEGQIYVFETNQRYYFNYSVYNGPTGPWRDLLVDVVIDEKNSIADVI